MFYFQALGSRRVQRGFDRVNLHRPTTFSMIITKKLSTTNQGLTLVHVRAQLEHIRDTFMGQVGLRGAERQLKLS